MIHLTALPAGLGYTAEDFLNQDLLGQYETAYPEECEKAVKDAQGYADRANALLLQRLRETGVEAVGNRHQHLDVTFWQSGKDISGRESQSHTGILIVTGEVKG